MKHVIIDCRLPRSVKNSLCDKGFTLIEMPEWERLQTPVSAHPDMLMFIAGDKIITHTDYFNAAKRQFETISCCGYDIVLSDEPVSEKYPNDILFNSVEIGELIFGKESNASRHIINYAMRSGKRFINVKQGYSKCSVAKVSDNAAITADTSLYKKMTERGIDVLLISQGNITLKGYDCGFIGGCSGRFDDKIYFSGNIELHPDYDRIKDFCRNHGKIAVSLSTEPLFDGGSLFFI